MITGKNLRFFCFLLTLALAAVPVLAEKGYWQFRGERFVKGVPMPVSAGDTSKVEASGSGSAITAVYTWSDFRSSASFSWTADGELAQLAPGTRIQFTVALTHSGDSAATAGITLQPYGQEPGTGSPTAQVIVDGLANIANQTAPEEGWLTVPEGPLYPDKLMEICFEIYPGGATSALYRTYEWVGISDPRYKDTDAVQAPIQEPELQPKPPEAQTEPEKERTIVDSKARLVGLTGTVEWTMEPDGSNWEAVETKTVIPVGAHIRTGPDSSAIIQFADMNTHVMKSGTEIIIETPPAPEIKLGLVWGRLWTNARMPWAEGATMEIGSRQAVAAIKGTILVMEASDLEDRAAVWKGKVEITHKKLETRVTLRAGEGVLITPEGFGAIEKIDIAEGIADWSDILPKESLKESIGAAAATGGTSEPEPKQTGWSGAWSTDFNRLVLTQEGIRVTGTYAYMGGRLEGSVQGNVLQGTWTQSNGRGRFEFRMSADGRSFTGKWGNRQTLTGGPWNGTRE